MIKNAVRTTGSSSWGLSLCAGVIACLGLGLGARGAPVPCPNLAIDPSTVPLGSYPKIQVNAGDSLTVPAGADPIFDIRIAPPVTLDPLAAYQCDVDYMADLESGDATLTFNRNGPYFVMVTRNSGLQHSMMVEVGVRSHGACGAGPATEIDCGTPKIVLVSSTLGFDHSWGSAGVIVTGIADARAAVAAASKANGGPIDVSIDAHGSSGNIQLGNDRINADNAAAFASSIEGNVSSLTIFACSVAQGDAGEELLCLLEQELGADTTGYTGENWDNPPGEEQKWWTAGSSFSWAPCSPTTALILTDHGISLLNFAEMRTSDADGSLGNADMALNDASSLTISALGHYNQAFKQADSCGPCAPPAQTIMLNIMQTLGEAEQQVQDARAQIQGARNQIQQARVQIGQARAQLAAARSQLQQSPPATSAAKQNIDAAKANLDRARQKLDRAQGELNRARQKLIRSYGKHLEVESQTQQASQIMASCGPCAQPALHSLQMGAQFNQAAGNSVQAGLQGLGMGMDAAAEAASAVADAETAANDASGALANCSECPADVAPPGGGDGVINVADLLRIIASWGPCTGCPEDFVPPGGNGVVNVGDLLGTIASWGACD